MCAKQRFLSTPTRHVHCELRSFLQKRWDWLGLKGEAKFGQSSRRKGATLVHGQPKWSEEAQLFAGVLPALGAGG